MVLVNLLMSLEDIEHTMQFPIAADVIVKTSGVLPAHCESSAPPPFVFTHQVEDMGGNI